MNILSVIKPAFIVLKQGQALANPAAWKNVQVLANLLSALIVLLNVFGIHFGLDSDSINLIAGGIAALANAYLTAATSEKVGVSDGLPPIELQGVATTAPAVAAQQLHDLPLPSEPDAESDHPTGFNG